MKVLLVGAGPMAVEYAKVLKALNCDYDVVGRGRKSALAFYTHTNKQVLENGIDTLIAQNELSNYGMAIVAVSEDKLGIVTRQLINNGVKKILVEKPGGLSIDDICSVKACAEAQGADVCVGYNRRYYNSTIEAKKIIAEDGGVTSFNFEFTEWSHVIGSLEKNKGVKEEWFLANSSHVIDLAFYLGGKPKEISAYTKGSLPWQPNSTIFAGAGISDEEALFSYSANWEAPGRWGVEILTSKHRLYLRPMEKLQIQNIGEIAINEVDLDYSLDVEYKPGLYRQVEAFINNCHHLLSIKEQCDMLSIYQRIRGW